METDQLMEEDLKAESLKENYNTNYLTHNFHSYPAKFIPKVPRETILSFTKEGDTILDPFCGSGTALVEAKLLNRGAIGIDLNPVAVLVSKAKTTKLDLHEIGQTLQTVSEIKKRINEYYSSGHISDDVVTPDFSNIEHWFQPDVITELAIMKCCIQKVKDENLRNYLYTAFSSIIVNVSNQESDTRFAAINKEVKQLSPFYEFKKKIHNMNKRMLEFSMTASDSQVSVYLADSTNLSFIGDNTIDHIVTSPPYANTYDYYLYHKFRILWLDHQVKDFQCKEIGSRNRHSSKKEDISTFRNSLFSCFKEMNRVLKPNKTAVVVIGDSVIRGELIRANELIKNISVETNFEVFKEKSYPLRKISKMFNPKFANKNKLEHVIFLRNLK